MTISFEIDIPCFIDMDSQVLYVSFDNQ